MKSKFLFAALASITLAACSNDELVSEQQTSDNANAIAFRTSVATTRGEVVQLGELQTSGFYAIALQSSTGNKNNTNLWGTAKKFSYDTSTGIFTTEEDVKWETVETKFFASNIDPNTHEFNIPTSSNASDLPSYVDFAPTKKIADQIDFVYATNKGTRTQFSAGIPLHFRHALAQIEVQAKCDKSTAKHTIKVKGYKLVYVCDKGTFTFQEPINSTTGKDEPVSSFATLTTTDAEAANSNGVKTQYVSNFYKGSGYGDAAYTGIKDETGNYIELDSKYKVIAGTVLSDGVYSSEGTAMILPQNVKAMGYDDANLESRGKGFYIALLVQIDQADGDALFPAMADGSDTERISYRGLPKYYGYIAIPVELKAIQAGKKYIYKFDLTDGLGYVDPAKPGTTDPNNDTYNPEDDQENNGDNNPGGGTDPYEPGNELTGSPFKFKVTMTEWNQADDGTAIDVEEIETKL